MSPLLQLPDELLLHILSFLRQSDLAKICLVNKRMKDLATDPELWTKLRMPNVTRLSHEEAKSLIDRCPKLKELNLLYTRENEEAEILAIQALEDTKLEKLQMDIFTVKLLKAISRSNSQLTSLEGKISKDNFKTIIYNFKYLRNMTKLRLSVHWTLVDKYLISEEERQDICNGVLEAIGRHCKKLEVMQFDSYCTAKGVASLLAEGALTNTLRELILTYGEPYDSLEAIQALEKCQHLEQLDTVLPTNGQLSGLTLTSITGGLSKLKTLRLNRCINLAANDFVQAFSSGRFVCHRLQKLTLNGCAALDDGGMEELANNCPELTFLQLKSNTKITDVGLGWVLSKCEKLKELHLYSIKRVTNRAFEETAVAPSLFRMYITRTF